ncbi:uncharacterized protein [Centruroides vittatus]|uniref:uncharacterized protein isoform X3 n=1 Tax=Centruroides vittatus TaxID=120091 RepID=UPI00350EE358
MGRTLLRTCLSILLLAVLVLAKKKSSSGDVIEEVGGKKLEKLIEEEEFLAVFFYTRTCRNCDKILTSLENIDDDAEKFGVAFVKSCEKSMAKKFGATSFPALVYFRNKEPSVFEGDLMDEKKVLDWLTDLDSMELPDRIEEVNAKILENLIEDTDFVAVLFYKDDCEKCVAVLHELENIDDEADGHDIGFVKISDEDLAEEYGLDDLPSLVYYRKKIPILYQGDLMNEEEVLQWLYEFQDIGDDDDLIEDVTANALEALVQKSSHLAVLFYDGDSKRSMKVLDQLENIDDEAKKDGITFVKTDSERACEDYGIEERPALVYFEKTLPNFYQGDLTKEDELLEWLIKQKETDEIEDVTEKALEQLIKSSNNIAVLFYETGDTLCEEVLQELENIDDDTDQHGITFVKIDDNDMAEEYDVHEFPTLIYFENQVPTLYEGDLMMIDELLQWLIDQSSSEEIEKINERVLEQMIEKTDFLAVLFFDEHDDDCRNALKELENIDDDADENKIPFVKIDDRKVADEYGIEDLPMLVYFENQIPYFYEGDLTDEYEVLEWLIHQKNADEIEDITDKVLDQMIEKTEYLAVFFYDKDNPTSQEILKELENIDDEADDKGLLFVRIDDEEVAREYGIDDELPILVYFENQIPFIYQGDLKNEDEVLKWLVKQMTSDEIEDVTDKMTDTLIDTHEHVAVLFYDKSKKSEKVLRELENIDDEADQNNIIFVKTDDKEASEKYGITKFPTLILFDDEIPNVYEGDLMKEEEVLDWLISQKSDEEIEDVTENMLDQLIENTPTLAVLFYDKKNPESEEILKELENIDDDLDGHDIPFVKIDDDSMAKEFGVKDELPILLYFENQLPSVYEGDLKNEEEVMSWLILQKEEDTIEEVTEEMLEELIEEKQYVLVFFAPNDCKNCEAILQELENIDDDTDKHGILFVTTDDTNFAKKKASVAKFPALVFFRQSHPILYKDDLMDEDKILKWVTSEDVLDNPDQIDLVNKQMLENMIDSSDYLAILFYKDQCEECEIVLKELENIDDDAEANDIDFVKVTDLSVAKEFSILTFPTLVFFRKRFPQFYDGDLKNEEQVLKWLLDNKHQKDDVIEYVDKKMLDVLIDDVENLVVYFYERNCHECEIFLQELEKIDDDTDRHGIHFVKTDDIKLAKDFGVTSLPTLVYFEDKIPSIYHGDLNKEEEVLAWLVHQKVEETIENVNREMFNRLIEEKTFLAVLFYVENNKESEEVVKELENIDDDCSEYGIHLVKMTDNVMAKKYGVRNPPGLIFFRHGKFIRYTGDMKNENAILQWLTSPESLDLNDVIEKANKKMFERILSKATYLATLFYSTKSCKQCNKVLERLEKIDDEADAAGIKFLKIDDAHLAKKFGVNSLPGLLLFKKGEKQPSVFTGDLKEEEKVLDWLVSQKDPRSERIEEFEGDALKALIENSESVAIYFYDKAKCSPCEGSVDTADCSDCNQVLEELENIDDDTDKYGIQFIKTTDTPIALNYGVKNFPSLVYFEKQVPSVYEGDLSAEEEVLQWLVQQKSEDTIEAVNREMLEHLIQEQQYLVVFFYKPNCKACDQALHELENIDDDTDVYGIYIVKIQDNQFARRYGIKTFPALIYFRNGNPLIFDGDLKNEESVLEWLIDDDNRELSDEIETINNRMLGKLVDDSPFLAVFFYEDNCYECDKTLQELENIDDEADLFGIDFVKIKDQEAANQWHVTHFPTLAYFRKKTPVFYEGSLLEEDKVLKWLTSLDVFEIKDEIEEVNRKMLDKLLEENEFVAVFFYDNNCPKCDLALQELERIDDEADDLDIMFVKIKDTRYAKKYGMNQVPGLVYFRRKFPSIYRGDLTNEDEVLEWLQSNRHRHPELNLFMYALAAISVAFILYTIVLMFCFKGAKEKKE